MLLFDAANTLIHKPSLWEKIQKTLKKFNYQVEQRVIKERHKLLSEIINFPDRTDKDFYLNFNSELLLSLGIIPTNELLEELFNNCKYQPWEAFDDCKFLNDINIKKAIISNFNSSLINLIDELIGVNIFSNIIISENENTRKPELKFYQTAIEKLEIEASEILYIGDSLKLDIIPAKKLGMNTLLIDRDNIYPNSEKRISSFKELKKYI